MTRDGGKNRDQVEFTSLDELVPEDHLVRKLENAIDWSFIYEMVADSYCEDNGRPSLDPVILIKLPVVQYMFGIRSMRQTIQEIKVNTAYRWFLGLGLHDPVPHFSTFGKNYMRRFKDSDLFEQIFQKILKECMEAGLVDESVVFVDSTHVKARANSKKYEDTIVEEQALWYEKELREEIDRDREAHGKKPLKDEPEEPQNDDVEPKPPKDSGKGKPNPNTSKKKKARQKKEKHIKQSTSDPESGWFRKGEHKNVFAYSVQTACDINGVVLGYSVHPGNENDGKTFPGVFEKIKHLNIEVMVIARFDKTDDEGMKEVKKWVASMENSLQRFEQTEAKYQAELDAAIAQFRELTGEAETMDKAELAEQRQLLRKTYTQDAVDKLQQAHGSKYSVFTMMDVKQDVDALLRDEERKLTPPVQKPPAKQQPEPRKKPPKRDYER